jgi:hypothetical protein
MAQKLVPISDISIGTWVDESSGTTNIYTSIDESSDSQDNSDFIQCSLTGTSEFKLSSGTDPLSSSGHIIRLSGKFAGGFASGTTVSLYEGTGGGKNVNC